MPNIIPVKAIPGSGSATALGEFNPGDVVDPAFLPPSVIDDSISDVEEEGVSTGGGPYAIIDFVGIATAADAGGGKVTVTIPDTNTDTLALTEVLEEGGALGGPFAALDFVGIGTAVNSGGGLCTITIPDTNTDVAIGDVEEESVSIGGPFTILNFTGIGTVVDSGGGKATLNIPDTNTDTQITDVEEEGVTTGGGPYSVINFIGAGVTAADAGGGQVDITVLGAGSLQAGVVFPGQWGYISAGNGGNAMNGNGLLEDMDAADNAAANVLLPTGIAFRQDSGGKGADTITSANSDLFFRYDNGLLMIQKFTFLETLNFISFCGLYRDLLNEPAEQNNIGGQGLGIMFSTTRPDTNFQFVAHTGLAQLLVDTTILKDALPHYVVIRENVVTPGNYDIELRNSDFSTIQASHTFTAAQLATVATLPMKMGLQTFATTGDVKQHDHYHGSIVLEGV